MNRYILYYALSLIVALSPVPKNVRAQAFNNDSLTLQQVWNIVDAGNSQLEVARLRCRESTVDVNISGDQLLPSFQVSGNAIRNSTFKIYPEGLFSSPDYFPVSRYGYGFGYSFNLNVYEGGQGRRNMMIKKEQRLKMQHELDLQQHNIHYLAAVLYYDLYKLLHFHDFLSSEITAQQKQLQTIESFYKNGIVMKSDVLRTKVKLSQLELSLSDLNKQIQIASLRLNILMGRGDHDQLVISYADTTMSVELTQRKDYMYYVELALSTSPAYKIAQHDLKIANLNSSQVKAKVLPNVSLFSYYNYTYPQVSYYPYTNQLWSFGQTGLKISYSLDNLYRNRQLSAKAKIIVAQQAETVKIRQDELLMDIREAFLQYEQAAEAVNTAEENIIQNMESVRVIRSSYINQESLLTDLLSAENSLLESKFALTAARVNLQLSHARLLAKTGIL